MITDDRDIVSAIRAHLASRVGKDRYEFWFGPQTHWSLQEESLLISVPSRFHQDWMRTHFRKELEAACRQAAGKPLGLEFRVQPSATDAQDATNGAVPADTLTADPLPAITAASTPAQGAQTAQGQPAAHTPPLQASGGERPKLRLAQSRRPLGTLEGFVVGDSNGLAYQAARMAIEQPGTYSPLVLHGPTGTGKSHLLEGIYSAHRKGRTRSAAVYLTAEQFTSEFIHGVHKGGMASFRAKYRELDLLIVDGLQFFHNKKSTIGELVQTIDMLQRGGRQVVFAADRSPAALNSLGPELISRLQGGMVCRIEPAEYETRLGIVRRQAAQLAMSVPEDVQAFIAARFTAQSRELQGALKRLHATSLAHRKPITLAMAEEALAELIEHQVRVVKLADIEKAVCDVCGLEPDSLHNGRKSKSVSYPRMLIMYLARKHTRAPLSEIGSYFGRRSHSTVISAQKKVEAWMAGGGGRKPSDTALSLEETLRRVEDQLRAG